MYHRSFCKIQENMKVLFSWTPFKLGYHLCLETASKSPPPHSDGQKGFGGFWKTLWNSGEFKWVRQRSLYLALWPEHNVNRWEAQSEASNHISSSPLWCHILKKMPCTFNSLTIEKDWRSKSVMGEIYFIQLEAQLEWVRWELRERLNVKEIEGDARKMIKSTADRS